MLFRCAEPRSIHLWDWAIYARMSMRTAAETLSQTYRCCPWFKRVRRLVRDFHDSSVLCSPGRKLSQV